jgi:hypothetical protein
LSTRFTLRALFLSLLLLVAPVVWACPYCAAQDKGDSFASFFVIAAMVLCPFFIVAIVAFLIRRADAYPSFRHTDELTQSSE